MSQHDTAQAVRKRTLLGKRAIEPQTQVRWLQANSIEANNSLIEPEYDRIGQNMTE
jgi:hypothetical protein